MLISSLSLPQYEWYIRPEGNITGVIADLSDNQYALGCQAGAVLVCEQDLAITTNLFQQFPQDVYILELKATNGQDATGTSQLSFFVNEPPAGGSCSLMMNGTVERLEPEISKYQKP